MILKYGHPPIFSLSDGSLRQDEVDKDLTEPAS